MSKSTNSLVEIIKGSLTINEAIFLRNNNDPRIKAALDSIGGFLEVQRTAIGVEYDPLKERYDFLYARYTYANLCPTWLDDPLHNPV